MCILTVVELNKLICCMLVYRHKTLTSIWYKAPGNYSIGSDGFIRRNGRGDPGSASAKIPIVTAIITFDAQCPVEYLPSALFAEYSGRGQLAHLIGINMLIFRTHDEIQAFACTGHFCCLNNREMLLMIISLSGKTTPKMTWVIVITQIFNYWLTNWHTDTSWDHLCELTHWHVMWSSMHVAKQCHCVCVCVCVTKKYWKLFKQGS